MHAKGHVNTWAERKVYNWKLSTTMITFNWNVKLVLLYPGKQKISLIFRDKMHTKYLV